MQEELGTSIITHVITYNNVRFLPRTFLHLRPHEYVYFGYNALSAKTVIREQEVQNIRMYTRQVSRLQKKNAQVDDCV